MAESERRRIVSSTPHLSPDEVVHRSFTTAFRGFSESEVRAFLEARVRGARRRRDREAELVGVVDSLEEQLRSPRPLNEPEMLDALGAETTRLLRSAREAADEIRARGEEHATEVLDSRARRRSGSARRRRRRRARAPRPPRHAPPRSWKTPRRAPPRCARRPRRTRSRSSSAASGTPRRSSRPRAGRGARCSTRRRARVERVLADLFRRRSLLQAQIDALRAGRDNLLDAYRVVKRTFLEATEALAHVEARAAAERASGEAEGVPVEGDGSHVDQAAAPAEFAEELAADATRDVESAEASQAGVEAPKDGVANALAPYASDASTPRADATDPNLADVDSLFARIRAGHAEAAVEPQPEPEAEAAATSPEPGPEPEAGPAAETASNTAPDGDAATAAAATPAAAGEPVGADAVGSWRSQRAEVLDPLLVSLGRRAKRAAQDDQNALLDAVRRHKGRPTADQVLVPESDLLAAWAGVLQEALDEAYGAGRVIAGGEAAPVDGALAQEIVATIVLPVRGRIASAIDAGEEGDTSGLVERIGARFREWKNQTLENALVDALALAWSRGVYDAAPAGAVLRWIPSVEGRCADCDDNGLEPTVKGSSFPTGQLHPPAHPGCRCLLAPADLLATLAANA